MGAQDQSPAGEPGPEYRTIPERTRRDVAPPSAGSAAGRAATLVVIAGADLGRIHSLAAARVGLGRSSKSDIQVDEEAVSRAHAEIVRAGQGLVIRDLGSTNGTFINDHRITREHALQEGDRVRVGRTTFKFLPDGSPESAYHDEIYRLKALDALTQVHNRAYLTAQLERDLARAVRERRELSFVLLDVDHFKQINDTHGHPAGDAVLRELAAVLRTLVRPGETLARYGGEEFALILPGTGARAAFERAEAMCRAVESTLFPHGQGRIPVTISLGVASLAPGCTDVAGLVKRADEKLYAAKRAGRNRAQA